MGSEGSHSLPFLLPLGAELHPFIVFLQLSFVLAYAGRAEAIHPRGLSQKVFGFQ